MQPVEDVTRRCKGGSPWTCGMRVKMLFWEWCWFLLCSWTPKPFNPWRLFLLRRFGAKVDGIPFVHQRARIQIPWHLILHDRCCLGDRCNLYSLDEIEIEEGAVVAQEAYICTGTHEFGQVGLPLVTKRIRIGRGAFVGARAFLLPGVTVGEGAIVGACSVVTCDIEPNTINVGNPCHFLKRISTSGTLDGVATLQ